MDKKEMIIEELRSQTEALKAEKEALAEERARFEQEKASEGAKIMATNNETREISSALLQVRADEGLKINSTGKDYYGTVVEKMRMEKPITAEASFLRGTFTGFQIPLISARPAVSASTTEGDTGLTVDSQMAIGRKTITPALFYAILGITYQTEKFSMVTDAEIEDCIAESFGEAIETAAQSRNAGATYPISGLLSTDTSVRAAANYVTAAAAGAVAWTDLYALVDKVKGKVGDWKLIVPSGIMSVLIATTTSDYNFCKEEYLRNGTVRGVKVIEVGTAVSHTAGDVYATVIDLKKNYKVAVASDDMILRKVADKNSLNTYIQGAMGMAAAVCLPGEVYQLVAASAS